MDEDDFNSSDIELPQAPPNPHAHRGAQSIEAMIASAFQDRRSSKVQSKMLKQTHGAAGTVIARTTWANRFDAFRIHTLKKSTEMVATAEDIERFLWSFPRSTKGKQRDPIAWTYLVGGMKHIINSLKFRYREFRLEPTDGVRLQSVVDQLHKQNLITKDPTREKLWLASKAVKQISNALLTDAIENDMKASSIQPAEATN